MSPTKLQDKYIIIISKFYYEHQGVLTWGSASCRNFLTKCASGVRNFKFLTEKKCNLKFSANKSFYKAKMAEEEHNMLDGLNLSNNRHVYRHCLAILSFKNYTKS